MRQLGFSICLFTSDLTRLISFSSWPSLTLAIIPGPNQLCSIYATRRLPGKSTNDKSSTPLPEMRTEIQLDEKDRDHISLARLLSGAFKNEAGSRFGFKIASWARRIRSSTSALSVRASPNGTFLVVGRGWSFSLTEKRNETWHCHSVVDEVNVHSIGHLVQVPLARGSVI
jgi:hypothetical protein